MELLKDYEIVIYQGNDSSNDKYHITGNEANKRLHSLRHYMNTHYINLKTTPFFDFDLRVDDALSSSLLSSESSSSPSLGDDVSLSFFFPGCVPLPPRLRRLSMDTGKNDKEIEGRHTSKEPTF